MTATAPQEFALSDMICVASLRDDATKFPLDKLFSDARKSSIAQLLTHMHGGKTEIVAEWDSMVAYIPDAAKSLIRQYPMLAKPSYPYRYAFSSEFRTKKVESWVDGVIEKADMDKRLPVQKIGEEKPAFTRQSAQVTGRGL